MVVLVTVLLLGQSTVKHHDQSNAEKKASLTWAFQRVRVHDGRAKAWWQEQLRAHIWIHVQGAESILGTAPDS